MQSIVHPQKLSIIFFCDMQLFYITASKNKLETKSNFFKHLTYFLLNLY